MTKRSLQFLSLGDSYTVGEGVLTHQRWVALAAEALRHAGLRVSVPRVIAKTGWTTDELKRQLELARPHNEFDLVTLMIGVNDQYRGRDIEDFAAEVVDLLGSAIGFAQNDHARVAVVSIPDWSVTPFAEGRDRELLPKEIDSFNAKLASIAAQAKVEFIDVTEISRLDPVDEEWLADDQLHPGPTMHALWAETITPRLRQMLVDKPTS